MFQDFGSIFSTLLPGAFSKLSAPEGISELEGLEIKVAFGGVWKESLTELSGGQRLVRYSYYCNNTYALPLLRIPDFLETSGHYNTIIKLLISTLYVRHNYIFMERQKI